MTRNAKMMIGAIVFTIASTVGLQLKANDYHHIDEAAMRIQKNTQRLASDLRHYSHTPQYRHLIKDTQTLRRLAAHVHRMTQYNARLDLIDKDVHEMDDAFHHLKNGFNQVEHDAEHGNGHIRGDTRHVKALLREIQTGIHHIQEDIERQQRANRFDDHYYQNRSRTYYGNQSGYYGNSRSRNGWNLNRGGITIGNGHSGIRINF